MSPCEASRWPVSSCVSSASVMDTQYAWDMIDPDLLSEGDDGADGAPCSAALCVVRTRTRSRTCQSAQTS